MDLRDLKIFLHLAESRHFGRSAQAMHVSPSTLSRQIQRLEEDLGQTLFLRDNRTVTLTDAGEQLKQFSPNKRFCNISNCATPSVSNGPSLSGELHFFAPSPPPTAIYRPSLTAFAQSIRWLKSSSPPAMRPTPWKKW